MLKYLSTAHVSYLLTKNWKWKCLITVTMISILILCTISRTINSQWETLFRNLLSLQKITRENQKKSEEHLGIILIPWWWKAWMFCQYQKNKNVSDRTETVLVIPKSVRRTVKKWLNSTHFHWKFPMVCSVLKCQISPADQATNKKRKT